MIYEGYVYVGMIIDENKYVKILLIDDEKFFIENVSMYMQKRITSEITCVTTASEALEIVKRKKFELIICDLKISDQAEGELILQLNALLPNQKFIVISAHELPVNLRAEKDLNITAYFEKPFNISEFEQKIKFIEQRNYQNVTL